MTDGARNREPNHRSEVQGKLSDNEIVANPPFGTERSTAQPTPNRDRNQDTRTDIGTETNIGNDNDTDTMPSGGR